MTIALFSQSAASLLHCALRRNGRNRLAVTMLAFSMFWFVKLGAADAVEPEYFGAKPGSLRLAKQRLASGDKSLVKALENLIKSADKAMEGELPSVLLKTSTPPSGDKHDYMSLAPYFWPDPKAKDGLPYIRHDGKVNPDSRDENMNDSPHLRRLGEIVRSCALAYFFTGADRYAKRAAQCARVWFIDEATRMNPHLKYAQAVRGVNEGRGTGILEGIHLATAADALSLLQGSGAWTAEDQKAISVWMQLYLNWLLASEAGQQERTAKNNHGTWFDVQVVRIALTLGQTKVAADFLNQVKSQRIAIQIETDGRQPMELNRTASFSYSRFNLEALGELAMMGEHVGVDLWHFATEDKRSIRRALDYMLPYLADPSKEWPGAQIKERHDDELLPLLRQAALIWPEADYEQVIGKFPEARSKQFQLLFLK